ncbi:MAG: zinc ABC transporter substrate-binding protein [Zestosphaera sp.]
MKRVAGYVLLSCTVILLFSTTVVAVDGLTIVTTSPGLADDVNLIKCESDRVYSLLPETADPHEYYLKPSDLSMLRQADLLVSTAHTHFELEINELISRGEINATLVEIPRIAGIRILKNPATLIDNLHTPTYDPQNYVAFLRNVTELMKRLNPSCSSVYETNYELLRSRVESLMNSKPNSMNMLVGIATEPTVQYAVAWLGINVTKLLIPEEGLSPTPATVIEIENAVRNREVDVLIVVKGGEYSSYLINLGRSYHVPVIEVLPPYMNGSTIDKLVHVLVQYTGLQNTETLGGVFDLPNTTSVTHAVSELIILLLLIVTIISYIISGGGRG